jgi:hypothetical protein
MLRITIFVLLSLSVLACSVKPATDYVIDHNFAQYQHFAFVATDPPPIKRTHFFHAAIASYSIGEQ